MECPGCGNHIDTYKKDQRKALQHHLWGGHRLGVIKSHELAEKIVEGRLSEQELLELKQESLPL